MAKEEIDKYSERIKQQLFNALSEEQKQEFVAHLKNYDSTSKRPIDGIGAEIKLVNGLWG